MFIKDLDFIIPNDTLCEVNIRDTEYNVIDSVRIRFIRIPVKFRKCELVNLYPHNHFLVMDCKDIENG